MRDKIIIFGAGEWGKIAYYYYCSKCTIECFIDNSEILWGTRFQDIEICNPQILKTKDLNEIKIVIANKRRNKQIQQQLYNQFGIHSYIVFQLEDRVEEYIAFDGKQEILDECIIEYEGGLGNQMFQYIFAKNFIKKRCHVTGDFSSYYNVGRREFVLTKVFPKISIPKCNIQLKKMYKENSDLYIIEDSILSVDKKEINLKVLKKEKGYFEGYWQSYYYTQLVEKEMLEDFEFVRKNDKKLLEIRNEIISKDAVSIHIRRGDYLEEKAKRIFGNICTDQYYSNAIQYIQEHVDNPVFYFFSNDIEWVKKNYKNYNNVYISGQIFDDYEDWYDMYLMSICKHNIIANSTFSWWGARLNKNKKKIVRAPKRWVNTCEYNEIYHPEWIKI